jgi:hypothetical protein
MIVTFNPRTELYELALVDANSDMGLGILVSTLENRRASPEVRHRFGKAATAIHEWTVAPISASLGGTVADVIIAVLPVAAAAAGLTGGGGPDAQEVSMRIVEILVSADRWLLQFFFTGPQGESLAAEMVCTRIQPGCQPQLGCELGCPGLVGCASGCEGFQPSSGVPQGQAPMMCQAAGVSAPCGCTAKGQAQLGCQTQLVGVSQGCLQTTAVPPPVVLAPPMCAPVQPCAPEPCPRQPVPPPTQPPPHPPGKPGHSHK